MKIDLLKKNDLNNFIQKQVNNLFHQLSPGKKQLELNEILKGENQVTVAYCENDQKIIGIALMGNYRVISGNKGWIEDVVVDEGARGKGIGKKLIVKLLEVAEEKKLSEIMLFTEDQKLSAIYLYNSLGFKLKKSKIYTLKLHDKPF